MTLFLSMFVWSHDFNRTLVNLHQVLLVDCRVLISLRQDSSWLYNLRAGDYPIKTGSQAPPAQASLITIGMLQLNINSFLLKSVEEV